MKIYLAGPMTGIPRHNFVAFQEAAEMLRLVGHEVISPAELHLDEDEFSRWCSVENAEPYDGPTREFQWYLKRDLAAMLTCDTVTTLPGWKNSRGANMEVDLAKQLDIPVVEYVTFCQNIVHELMAKMTKDEALQDRAISMSAQILAMRDVHGPVLLGSAGGAVRKCGHDHRRWPCPTIRAGREAAGVSGEELER